MRRYLLLFGALLVEACAAHRPEYRLDDRVAPQASGAYAIRVAVGSFEDIRDPDDVPPVALTGCQSAQVSLAKGALEETVARYLQHAGVFGHVEMVEAALGTPTQLPQLKAAGFDALLLGKLTQYQGSYCTPESSLLDVVFFPISIVYKLAWQPRLHVGITELVDVTLLDTRTGRVLWSGQASEKVTETYGGLGRAQVADKSLQQAVSSLADQLKLRALVTQP